MLLCLFAGAGKAITLTGTVYSTTTCSPISGQMVFVRDSMNTWHDSTVTNSSGFYSFTIPSTVYAGGSGDLFTSTAACGSMNYGIAHYVAGYGVNSDFIVCGGTPYYLQGRVLLGSSTTAQAGDAKVWLIRRDVAPVTFDTSLVAVDSQLTSGMYGGYVFRKPCAPSASSVYYVKGALLPSSANYSSYLPTYADSSLQWNGARNLSGSLFSQMPSTSYHIYLKAGSNPGGPGFIGGSVLLGANKTAGVGDPLSSRMLILTTSTGKAIGYTYSDAAGKFQFPSVPLGAYRIFGDAQGKLNPILNVTLTAAKPSITTIIFEENSKKFEGRFSGVGVGSINSLAGVSVFPNPATDFVNVAGLNTIGGSKTIILSSITGAEISRQTINADAARIATASLPAGIYLLQVQTEAGSASYRIIR